MRRGTSVVKQINVWPMVALLVVVLFIIFWLSGGLAR
jgi:biopolymer transport protein ExbD